MVDSSYMQELERRAQDLLRVYNPLDEDYVVEWDRKNGTKLFRVPAESEAVLVRYIAEKYIREMYQKIVMEEVDRAVEEKNQERIEKGMAEMDKTLRTGEQMNFETPLLNKSKEEQKRIIASLYVGVEREYGRDVETVRAEEEESKDFEDVLEEVQEQKNTPSSPQTSSNAQTKGDKMSEDTTTSEKTAKNGSDEATGTENSGKTVYSCDFPGCDFETETKIALTGHKRSHESAKKEAAASISK